MNRELAAEYGIDIDKGLLNCMGNSVFYAKILKMFLADTCFSRAKNAYLKRDYKALFICAHELKGISGNAALVRLYSLSVPFVELLRDNNASDADVDRCFGEISSAYTRACEGIRLMLSEN